MLSSSSRDRPLFHTRITTISCCCSLSQASEIKQWLVQHTLLVDEQVLVQAGADQDWQEVDVATEVDCVLMLQTADLLRRPACLAHVFCAVSAGVPVVPVVLTSSNWRHAEMLYSYEHARVQLQSLGEDMREADIAAVEAAAQHDIATVGTALDATLPHIISKPLGLDGSVGEREAQMLQIERAVRLQMASTKRHMLVKWLLVKPKVLAHVKLTQALSKGPSNLASWSILRALLTLYINPGSLYRLRQERLRAAYCPRQEEKGAEPCLQNDNRRPQVRADSAGESAGHGRV